jgi:hypothetical protein
VHQLKWVGIPARLIQKAVIDYYRAYAQTSRWIDDDLIGIEELEAFEARLRDEWEREYEWMVTELPADADESAKRRAGLRLLRETLDRTGIRVRERYDQAFFCRGKHGEAARHQHGQARQRCRYDPAVQRQAGRRDRRDRQAREHHRED